MNRNSLPIQRVPDRPLLSRLATAREAEIQISMAALGRSRSWISGERCIDDFVLWYFLRGGVEGTVGGETASVTIPEGSFHCLAPRVPHSLRKISDEGPLRNYVVRFQLRVGGRLIAPRWQRLHLPQAQTSREWMERLYLAHTLRGPFWFEKFRAFLGALFAEAFEEQACVGSPALPSRRQFTPGEIKELNALVDDGIPRGITPAELAEQFELSLDYFTRKFRATFGVAPREWLKRERLKRATLLLIESHMTIQEIAYDLGFDDQRFFARQFKAFTGETPTEYRARR